MSLRRFSWWLLLVGTLGCDSTPSGPSLASPAFRLGQRWVYVYDGELRDSLGAVLVQEHDSVEVIVGSTNESIAGRVGLIRLDARSLLPWFGPGPAPGTESCWYEASDTQLVEYAYHNAGAVPMVMLKVGGDQRSPARQLSFFHPVAVVESGAPGDTIQWREDPRVVLKLPLTTGRAWDSFRFPFYQRREVADFEVITSGGRTERAARIRTTIPAFQLEMEWDDWVSERGLLRRSIRMTSVMTGPDLEDVGRATTTNLLTLVSVD